MTEQLDDYDAIRCCLDRLRDGDCGAAELVRLEKCLRNNPEACRLYVEVLLTEVALPRVLAGVFSMSHDRAADITTGPEGQADKNVCPTVPSLLSDEAETRQPAMARRRSRTKPTEENVASPRRASSPAGLRGLAHDFIGEPVALATLVLVMIFGGVLFWNLSRLNPPPPQPIVQQPPPSRPVDTPPIVVQPEIQNPVVARLTGSVNASWESAGALTDGALLKINQRLTLKQGLAEIAFDSGATVILEGPAELEVGTAKVAGRTEKSGEKDDRNACVLTLGKLVARVPQQATGFTVATPTMTIVDLGTEFGIFVTPAKDLKRDNRNPTPPLTEVHVLRGEVQILREAPKSEIVNPKPEILTAGQAISSEPGGAAPRVVPAEPTRFVRELPAENVATAPLQPGDILAVTRKALKLVKIDPTTGKQTLLVQGDRTKHGTDWMCTAVDARRRVLIGAGFADASGGVLRFDPRDGRLEVVARQGLLAAGCVRGLAVAPDGTIFAAVATDRAHHDEKHANHDLIVKIDPASGAATELAKVSEGAWGLCLDGRGGLLHVSDLGAVVYIKPDYVAGDGVETLVGGESVQGAHGVALLPDGRLLVSINNGGGRSIVEIDRQAHKALPLATLAENPGHFLGLLAAEADGNLIAGQFAPDGAVYRVNLAEKKFTLLSTGGHLEEAGGVAVVPSQPAARAEGGVP